MELIIDSALRARITVFTLIKLCRRSGPAQGNSQISRTSTFSFLVTKLHSLLVSNSTIKHYGGGGEIGWMGGGVGMLALFCVTLKGGAEHFFLNT